MTAIETARTINRSARNERDENAISELKPQLRGELLRPGDSGFDDARRVYNGMIDRTPKVIVRAVDAADVIATVKMARETGLALSIRGGGHNVAGFGTNDDGIVLDLSKMRGVRVDPANRIAVVDGGATWADVDHATHAFGLATPGGVLSTTGVAGLTLGGGFGYLTRKYGLCCDNLVSADIVTADGNFVTASAKQNPDLFWAIRGGGGNFGVAVSFTFRLHPVSMVYGGPVFYPADKAGEVMRFYRDFISQAPEELGAFFAFHVAPPAPFVPEHLHHVPVCAIVSCWSGDMAEAERVLAPIRAIVPPVLDLMGPLPYPALNSMFDALLPAGLQHYWKADFDRELNSEAIAVHEEFGPRTPNFMSLMHLYPLDGAVNRVGKDETSFGHRDIRFVHIIAGIDSDPANMTAHTAWVRDYWSALHPHSAGGAYVNFLMDEGQDRVRTTYRDQYPRLAKVKQSWDPDNLFRMNQNIRPES